MKFDIQGEILIKSDEETNPEYGCDPEKRGIEEYIRKGVVNIDKPAGPTSHQVSAYVKEILHLNKAGHSGTLDPKVTGCLPVELEDSVKIVRTLLPYGKEYIVVMKLHQAASKKRVKKLLKYFVGELYQKPPLKSAVKRQLRKRTIYSIKFREKEDNFVLFRVECEAGTYMRKLCLHPNTDILSESGFIPIEDFYCKQQPKKVYSIENKNNKNNRIVDKIPSAFQKLPSPEKLIKLTMSSGISIITTPDHEMLTSFKEGYKMTETEKLAEGDYLVKSLIIPKNSKEYVISDLLDDDYLIDQPDIKEKCKGAFIETYESIREMNRQIKLDRKAFLSKSENAISIKHLKLAGIYDDVKNNIYSFKTQKGKVININKFTPDFFYLLGLVASDGNNTKEKNTKRHTRIKFHNKNEKLIDIFLEKYKKIFPGINISKKKAHANENLFELDTSNSFFATVAASLGVVSPQKYSDILQILNADVELIKAFLRGYFDGDGTAYYKKKTNIRGYYTDIRLFSVNYVTAKRIHQMLLKLNIPNKIFKKEDKYYIVSLESMASKKRFITKIGTNHPGKKKVFEKILKIKGIGRKQIDDHYYAGFHYKEYVRKNRSKLSKMGGNLNRVLTNTTPITRGFYKKAAGLTKLPSVDECIIEKINKIEFINFEGYVYDMTIPGTHNFLIETGFVSSNCHDIGLILGVGAHMQELRRSKAGPFDETSLVTLHDLKDAYEFYKESGDEKYLRNLIKPMEQAVSHLKKIWINDGAVNALCHGANLNAPGVAKLETGIETGEMVAVFSLKDELVALGKALHNSDTIYKAERGAVVDLERVIMATDIYPKMWKKKEE